MRHRLNAVQLGRSSAHRKALLANLVCQLIAEKRIVTTVVKAKAAGRLADKMVTLAKQGTLPARRRAIAMLRQNERVRTLFDEIAQKCKDRNGGYTRVTKLGCRRSDSSLMAMLEWVSVAAVDKKKKPAAAGETAPGDSTPK